MNLDTQLNRNKNYRADIEGMRAIAILLVIAAHFGVPGFYAGFIGVDIFFVLSGYLITSILVREYETSQTIRLARFYANRLRRLLPALATMVILSSLAAYYLLPESQNLAHSKAGAASALWLSNIYFAFSDVDYFAAENSRNIFLHTWSLGVEEQFYLIWPFALLGVLSIAKAITLNNRLFIAFSTIALVSFIGCMYFALNNPTIAFYMTPARAWQFSIGGFAWLLGRYHLPDLKLAHITGFLGLVLIASALLLIDEFSVYPGSLALLPTLGAALLLWSGSGNLKNQRIAAFLSIAPMQKIGHLSYSWYLWHWPVLLISDELISVKGDLANSIFAIALSLLLAIVTFRLIENPFRFGKPSKLQIRWQIISALAIIVLLNAQLLRWHTLSQEQLSSGFNQFVASSTADIPFIYGDGCDDWYQSSELKPCVYGNEDAEKTAVLLGDSIGAQWFSALTHMHEPAQWRIVVLTKSSCPMVDEPYFYARIGREYTECSEWRDRAIEWLGKQKIDRLFIGGTASAEFTDEQWKTGTVRILDKLATTVNSIYFVEANPTLPFNGPDCLLKSKAVSNGVKNCRAPAENSRYTHVANILENITKQFKNVHWLATANFVCPNQICTALTKNSTGDEVIVFRDSQHLTDSFVATGAPYFKQQIEMYELQDYSSDNKD